MTRHRADAELACRANGSPGVCPSQQRFVQPARPRLPCNSAAGISYAFRLESPRCRTPAWRRPVLRQRRGWTREETAGFGWECAENGRSTDVQPESKRQGGRYPKLAFWVSDAYGRNIWSNQLSLLSSFHQNYSTRPETLGVDRAATENPRLGAEMVWRRSIRPPRFASGL